MSNLALTTARRLPSRATVVGTWKSGLVMRFSIDPDERSWIELDHSDLIQHVLNGIEPPGLEEDAVHSRHGRTLDERAFSAVRVDREQRPEAGMGDDQGLSVRSRSDAVQVEIEGGVGWPVPERPTRSGVPSAPPGPIGTR